MRSLVAFSTKRAISGLFAEQPVFTPSSFRRTSFKSHNLIMAPSDWPIKFSQNDISQEELENFPAYRTWRNTISQALQDAGKLQLQLIAAKAAQDELDSLFKSGVLPKAVYEELWASYQARVAESERVLRDFHNQYRGGRLERDRPGLDAIRRRLLLAEKGAVRDALRKRIVPEDLVQPYIKDLDGKLLSLEDD